jgi:hypothetical protein
MNDFGIKVSIASAIVIAALTSIPLLAQQAGANADAQGGTSANAAGAQLGDSTNAGANANPGGVEANGSANASGKTTYAPTAAGFGDQAASHTYEMTSVTGELEGKLNTKTAKVGDQVVLKTMEKVQTSDGTVIPKGTRLVGHVTEVQAYSKERGASQLGIAFDRAELKNGQDIAVHTLIRGVSPGASATAMDSMDDDAMMGMPAGGGGRMGSGPAMGGSRGSGILGGAGGAMGGAADRTGVMAGGAVDTTANAATSMDDRVNSNLGATANGAAGHGGLGVDTGAHGVQAARAIPRPTGISGVMLAGNSTSSGVLSASKRNIQFESGTQMQLGIVADK